MVKRTSKPPSRSAALQALRQKMGERPDLNDSFKTIMGFKQGMMHEGDPDRSIALLIGSILENALEAAILTHCIQMDNDEQRRLFGNDPTQTAMTFDVKIRIGYALGIYGATSRSDLECLRTIRNLFAHAKTFVSFHTEEILQACNHLNIIDMIPWGGVMGKYPADPRQKFVESSLHYFILFAVREDKSKPIRYLDNQLYALYS
jgi:hypothetical protein